LTLGIPNDFEREEYQLFTLHPIILCRAMCDKRQKPVNNGNISSEKNEGLIVILTDERLCTNSENLDLPPLNELFVFWGSSLDGLPPPLPPSLPPGGDLALALRRALARLPLLPGQDRLGPLGSNHHKGMKPPPSPPQILERCCLLFVPPSSRRFIGLLDIAQPEVTQDRQRCFNQPCTVYRKTFFIL